MAFKKTKKTIAKKEPSVVMCRHGSTNFNNTDKSEDRIRGWIDIPLNDEGRQDASKAGKDLKKKYKLDAIYTSDLVRVKETADIINQRYDLPLIVTSDLRPWNLGVYQGKVTADILPELNDMVRFEDKVPKDGESFKQFRLRFLSKIQKIINDAVRNHQEILVVSHYRNLKTIDAWVSKGMPSDFTIDVDVMLEDKFKPGEIYKIPLHGK
jgi:broad specificity phosphatase PhoE